MTNQVHLAAQYLAVAGNTFLEKKEDDSHTNLGFNTKKGFLETWPLNDEGCKVAFDYHQFSLHWLENETVSVTFLLDGKTHKEVVEWMNNVTAALERTEPYLFELHYELPYEKITDDFTFVKPEQKELDMLLALRKLTQNAMSHVVDKMDLETTIRVWPHHFDIGGYEVLDSKIGVGFGMAIPDSMIADFYLYTSGYKGHEAVDTLGFKELAKGIWKNDGFKGGLLPMIGVDEDQAITFFSETIQQYKSM